MASHLWNRRRFLQVFGADDVGAAVSANRVPVAAGETPARDLVVVDPKPRFDLSPHLYMQFMEPLSATDSSVDAAWDFVRNRWRADVVEISKVLSPSLIRWGGCFSTYEVFEHRPEHTFPRQADLPASGPWVFPPASVSAVELRVRPA